jgi:hypothetical protein
MKLKEKLSFGALGTMIFFISGGLACTYSTTNVVNPILAVILGGLVFVTIGASACTYSNNKIAKRKATQIAQ